MRTEALTNSGTFVVTNLKESLAGTGLKGVIAIDHNGSNDVTLQGSVDNSHFVNIETFSADTIKEITLAPYLRVNGDATGSAATIGSSTATLMYENNCPKQYL